MAQRQRIWYRPHRTLMRQTCCAAASIMFAGCALAWSEDRTITSAPYLKAQPTVVETRNQAFTDAVSLRLKQRSGGAYLEWSEVAAVAGRLVNRAITTGGLRPQRATSNALKLVDRRVFLVAIQPDILLLVPHRYEMEVQAGGARVWHDGSVNIQFRELLARQKKQFGLSYGSVGLHHVGLGNYVELSTVFPDEHGIEVVSDGWVGAIPLTQMDARADWPFRTESAQGVPGFLRLVPRNVEPSRPQ